MNTEFESPVPSLQQRVATLVEHRYFTGFITVLILINAVTLGLETDRDVMASIGPELHAFVTLILLIFTV